MLHKLTVCNLRKTALSREAESIVNPDYLITNGLIIKADQLRTIGEITNSCELIYSYLKIIEYPVQPTSTQVNTESNNDDSKI